MDSKQANKSTDLVDYVHNGLTEKSSVGAVFMDLSFAFDHFGFRGSFLTFLMIFLKDGKYFVSVNGNSSDTKVSNNGVPQGSNLGPLFFLIYVNPLTAIHFNRSLP